MLKKSCTFILLFLCASMLYAQDHGEPPIKAPYPEKLDRAAANKWWEVAKAGREKKISDRRHPKGSLTATGRNFYDLECPRDQVVAFALYTVHNRTLKMSAQLHPLFPDETRTVRLEVQRDGAWKEIATAKVNDLGWSALFRVEKWDDTKSVSYRVRHGAKAMFEGTIRRNPVNKDVVVVASLSCNSSRDRMGRPLYVRNLLAADPDLLFFAGDQHYDHTEHTAGWLMWGAQFRDVIKNRPVITIPDDHDVGQGNLWGEGGIPGKGNGNSGGYIYHPEYVKQVERCQTAHLPDPYDPTPIAQGINVYYTSYNLGGIDFAILEDRKFKSGPGGKLPKGKGRRPDHISKSDYDPKSLDLPTLKLLGERQLKFLNDWSDNWQGVQMKAVLSQTPFCGAAHMHGGSTKRLYADLDSNGWPQTGRNKALRAIRKGFACHLSGDQHLTTLLQHGIDEFNDGPWSMVSPAIVNSIYGRYWHPVGEKPGANRPADSPLPYTGEYLDGFHNRLTMYGYANPNAPENKSNRAAGFVIARFNKKDRTITAECWPRDADLRKDDAKQFAGWPKVIPQIDNYNPPSWGKLGELTFNRSNPVVQLIDASNREVVYTLRVSGKKFTPHAPKTGSFTIKAGIDAADTVIGKATSVSAAKPQKVTLR